MPALGRAAAVRAERGRARRGQRGPGAPGLAMDSALQVAEEEVVAAESCGPSSKFEDIYRLLAEGCFPPSFCSIKRKNLKRYAQKFVVDGGDPSGTAGQPGRAAGGTRRQRPPCPWPPRGDPGTLRGGGSTVTVTVTVTQCGKAKGAGPPGCAVPAARGVMWLL